MLKSCIIKQPLAIVGIACRFPGADNPDQFWNLIRNGTCSISELPSDRLERSLYYSSAKGKGSEGKTYSALSGVVSLPDLDPKLCAEPDAYDPAHLIMLEVAANACRDAGWDPLALPLRNTGVYIGHARTSSVPAEITFSTHLEDAIACLRQTPAFESLADFLRRSIADDIIFSLRRNKPHMRENGTPYMDPAMAATLIAQSLGLTGPHMVIDAACASSLVAVALAAGPLQEGRLDMAIVGGASFSNWQSMALFSKALALSAEGSYPFDRRADGFVSADGYSAVILKTLDRALSDGDRIHAVIRGIGMSSDGRGKSLWAPRREGQVEAIQRAYAGGIDPSLIQYIEAHGTSTQLGDATELKSLAEVFGPVLPSGRKIPITSVKGNIGHTCETAGLAGLIKAVLAMKHGCIPPAAGFSHPSPEIDLTRLPFVIPTESLQWAPLTDNRPRRAAVDAFGIGGLNVHLVFDEFVSSLKPSVAVSEEADPMEGEDVAIIGAGAVFPGARTAAAFWEMLASGRDPKSPVPPERWDPDIYLDPDTIRPGRATSCIGGFVDDFKLDPMKFRIPPKQMETADPLQFMVLDAADQALKDAGYDTKKFDRRRVAVIVGTMFCSDFSRNLTVALQYPEFERELQRLLKEKELPEESVRSILADTRKIFHQRKTMLRDETGSFSASTLASRIARTLDFMGGAFSLDAEEASSAAALDAAVTLLRSGACDMVLCAGAQRSMDVGIYEEYALRGLLTDEEGGFLPAEGAGMVLLKRAKDALRDGDRIYGVIREIRAGRGEVRSLQDPVARQMGHALGASAMASLLASIAPGAPESTIVTAATPRGLNYEVDIEKKSSDRQNRVAFLFPGQGSQYTGMLKDLVKESAAAAAKLKEIDALMTRLGFQTFSEIAWEPGSGLGADPWQTQVSMLLADVLVLEVLKDLGMRPDVVAGHSYGEFPALVAAGAWTLEQAIRATRIRADLVRSSIGADCRLMATNAPEADARRIIGEAGLPVHIAVVNASDQIILGGSRGDLEVILQSLESEDRHCTLLPLPGAFHTPLLADIRDPFLQALTSIPMLPPQIPLLSGISLRYVAEPAEIRENLAVQPSTRLNYPEMIQRLADEGVSVFVEAGPRQVLTQLNKRILGDGTISVACDPPRKPGLNALDPIKRTLESCGFENPPRDFSGRQPAFPAGQKHETLYFDATLRRREKNLNRGDRLTSATEETGIPEASPEASLNGETNWSAYLIQFVCEQTGYAPEVVDLDADLESDLGVDSIKKMQLFGELRERFDLSGLQPAALAGITTLRHVLDFLQNGAKVRESGAAVSPPSSDSEKDRSMKVFRLQGSPYEMGKEHGRRQAGEIHAVVRTYSEILGGDIDERQDLKYAMKNLDAYFSRAGMDELRGLAEGTGLPLNIIVGLNLGLMPELLPGCSHFAFRDADNKGRNFLHGANEDAPLLLTLGRSVMPAALARHPDGGIPHLTFVLPGQFAGINGINARGLAVSSTMLLDRVSGRVLTPGRIHGDLVKEILETAVDIETAVNVVRGSSRIGGWGLLISHQSMQKLCYLEYDEAEVTVNAQPDRLIGANHSLLQASGNGNHAPGHSFDRLRRLETLLVSNGNGSCSMETARAALRDCRDPSLNGRTTRPTMSTVRRVDNLMSLVMRPQQDEVWVAAGLDAETYQRLDLKGLLDPHIMRRWVMRAVESPIGPSEPFRLRGAGFVIGDNPAARELQLQLGRMGADRVDLSEKPERALELLEKATDSDPVPHLFLMSGLDAQPPDLLAVFETCRLWVERIQATGLLSRATLAAATRLGGDFGFSGHVDRAEGGGVSGLLKAIRREFPEIKVKVLDTLHKDPPGRLATEMLHELGSAAVEAEVGYRMGKRFTVHAFERPALPRSPVSITRGGVWIATGGSGGITAYVARALAEAYDLKLHVFGRSASAELEFPAVYHCCDVADAASMDAAIERIRRESGPIRGILHGAGVEYAAGFERKSMERVQSTIASKVNGALHLMELTRQDPLEVVLAFGSISGRFGGHGQTDYSLASDMLAKLIQRFRHERPDCASVLFHWPAWDEIGMSARPESRAALEMAGQRLMPPKEGLNHILAELNAGAPEGEVLILDGPGTLDLDGGMRPKGVETAQTPLLEGALQISPDRIVSEIRFDPTADPFLRQHCYRGNPLLPAVAGLEALAEGVRLFDGKGPLSLCDVDIHNGLRFQDRRPLSARVDVTRNNGGLECRLVSEFRSRSGRLVDPDRVLISCKVQPDASGVSEPVFEEIEATRYPVQYPEDGPMIHGPSFQCLKELAFDGERGFGGIRAQSPGILAGGRRGAWAVPVAELDACLVACAGYALKNLGVLALPKRFDRLRFFRQPVGGEMCRVQLCYRGKDEILARFDFILFGSDGRPILQVDGFGAATVMSEGQP